MKIPGTYLLPPGTGINTARRSVLDNTKFAMFPSSLPNGGQHDNTCATFGRPLQAALVAHTVWDIRDPRYYEHTRYLYLFYLLRQVRA